LQNDVVHHFPILSDIEFDGDSTVNFKVVFPSSKTIELALCIPDNYPKEDFTLITQSSSLAISSDIKTYPASSLVDALERIVDGNLFDD